MPAKFRFEFEKAFAAILYLASKPDLVPEFDKLKAAKLLFLADKYHLVRYGRPILGDEYRALTYGPVPQITMDFLHAVVDPDSKGGFVDRDNAKRLAGALTIDRGYKYPRFSGKEQVNFYDFLSKSDLAALDHIISIYGKKSAIELSALTHAMPAYQKAWESRGMEAAVDMKYEDFFEGDPDAIDGALEEMIENNELNEAFPPKKVRAR